VPDPLALIDAADASPAAGAGSTPLTGQKPPVDPIDFITTGGAVGDRLAAATRTGLEQDPAKAARRLKLRDRLGIPSYLLGDDLDAIEREAAQAGFDPVAFRRTSPKVAEWVAQSPELAAISRDDLPKLAAAEQFVAQSPDYKFLPNGRIQGPPSGGFAQEFADSHALMQDLTKRATNGELDAIDRAKAVADLRDRLGPAANLVAGMAQSLASTKKAIGVGTADDRNATEALTQTSQELSPGLWGDIQRGVGGVVADAPLMLAGGIFARGAQSLAALANMGKIATGALTTAAAVQPLALREGINTAQESGWANGLAAWGIETAIPAAFGQTGVERVISKLAARGVSREIAAGFIPASLGLLKEAGLEATEEATTELAHALHEAAAGIDPQALDPSKLWKRMAAAGAVGGLAGGTFNAPEAIARMAAKPDPVAHLQQGMAAVSLAGLVSTVSSELGATTTAQQYAPGAKSFAQGLLSGHIETVYIDRADWDRVMTAAKLDPQSMLVEAMAGAAPAPGQRETPADAKRRADASTVYTDAGKLNHPIPIKTWELVHWLGKRTELRQALSNELRGDPQAMSAREFAEGMAKQEDITADPAAPAQNTAAEEAQAIEDEIAQQIAATGTPEGTARDMARQMATVFRVTAARFNEGKAPDAPDRLTPATLFKSMGLSVTRPLPGVLTAKTGASPDLIVASARARAKAAATIAGIEATTRATAAEEAARRAADAKLAADAAGKPGEAIIDDATARLRAEAKRTGLMSYTDAMVALGADFGFRADAKQQLSAEQEARGRLLTTALRVRGSNLRQLMDDAGVAKAETTPAAENAAPAPPVTYNAGLIADATRLATLGRQILDPRVSTALTEDQLSQALEEATALAQRVQPELGNLPLEPGVAADVRQALSLVSEGDAAAGQTLSQEPPGAGIRALEYSWKKLGVDASISESNGVITLSKIIVPKDSRGNGIGTKAMQELVDYAERTGQYIALTPSSSFGGSTARLREFYKRFGFAENKGKGRFQSVSETMVREPANPGRTLYQPAYHGTGNSQPYDRFDYNRVGGPGGEGAQAYGWGLYFAGKKEVGKWYKDTLAPVGLKLNGKDVIYPPGSPKDAAFASLEEAVVAGAKDPWSVAIADQERIAKTATEAGKKLHGDAVDALKEWRDKGAEITGGGRLYTVDIPEDSEMLDWDKPINEQGAVAAAAFKAAREQFGDDIRGARGSAFYDSLAQAIAREIKAKTGSMPFDTVAAKAASDWLRQHGVPGLRYLDGSSRGNGQGSHNYVIFDDSKVAIKSYEQQARGAITFDWKGSDRQTTIRLFDTANLSTFLHESGHLYLELLGDLADRPGAPQQIKDDYAAALKWLGVEKRADIRTEHHEQWARGIESYLMEGKAPSNDLRGLFSRFAGWLKMLYREVANLRSPINDDVRRVMDRLYATDEEIAQAQQAQGDDGFTAHAAALGLTPEQAQGIATANQEATRAAVDELRAEVMTTIQREQTAAWKAQREMVRAEVASELAHDKTQIAASMLRRGVYPDGSAAPTGQTRVRFDSVDLTHHLERLYPDAAERIAARRRLGFMGAREDGMPVDAVAPLFGFSSGAELVRALVEAKPFSSLVDAETMVRMRERYGDPLLDGTVPQQATEVLHRDRQADVIMAKLRALSRRTGKRVAPVELMRETARRKIAGEKAGSILPHIYLRAERKATDAMAEAMARQDWQSAQAAAQLRLLNHELYRAATEARADVDKARELAQALQERKRQEQIGKAGGWEWTITAPDGGTTTATSEDEARKAAATIPGATWERTSSYVDQINAILERYNFRRGTAKDAERRRSLAAWIDAQNKAGAQVNLPDVLLREARKVDWRQVTVDELRAVTDGLQHIAAMASLKNRLSKRQKQRDAEKLAGELIATLERTHPTKRIPPAEGGRTSQTKERLGRFIAAHRKASFIARAMDGNEDGGPFWDAIIRPLNEAGDQEAQMLGEASTRQDAIWNDWRKATARDDWGANDARPFDGFHGGLTRMGAIMVALNWGNEGNRQRLLEGNQVTVAQVQAVLDSLSEADWTLVEAVWDHINSHWSEIAALEQRVTGVAPEKVEAIPFPTRYGTVKGGYFPVVIDSDAAPPRVDAAAIDIAQHIQAQAYGRAVTKHGHTKERTLGQGKPLLLDPSVIGRHLSQVIHDLTHREALSDVARIIARDDVASAIQSRMGKGDLVQLKQWLADIAASTAPPDGARQAIQWLRRGFSISTMGLRPMTALLQLTGFSNAAYRVGPGRMLWAIRDLFSGEDGQNRFAWVESKSDMMANRSRTHLREVNETITAMRQDRVGRFTAVMDQLAFAMMRQTQRIVDTATWTAAYAKFLEEGHAEDRAIALANQTVLDTQSGGQAKDLAGVQRDKVGQLLTAAMTYGSLVYNQLGDVRGTAVQRYRAEGLKPALGESMAGLFFVVLLPAAMTLALRELLRGQPPEDKRDPIAQRYAGELASTMLGTMVGVRELGGAVQGFSYEGPAATRGFSTLNALIGQIRQGDADAGLARAAIDAAGTTFGLPSGQVMATARGIMYLWDNPRPDPRPLLFGPPPKQ